MTDLSRCGLLPAHAWSLPSIPASGSYAESDKDGCSKDRLTLRYSDCRNLPFRIARLRYTPFALKGLGDASGQILLAFVWSAALTGAALKLWAPRLLRSGVSTALYLMLGWCGIAAFEPLFRALSLSSLILLAAGGALYSLGAAFHHWQRLPFHNAIWHGFVLAAATCHYGAILSGVVLTTDTSRGGLFSGPPFSL